jgi:predicted secreted protein
VAREYILGKDLILYFNYNGQYYALAHSTDCELNISTDKQETTTKNTLRGRTFDFIGKYTYTLKTTGFCSFFDVPSFVALQQLIMAGTKIQFTFTDQFSVQYSGTILVTNSDITSRFDQVAAFTNEMTGDGELSIVTTDVPPIPLPSENVTIIDQVGDIVATIVAPGSYSVLRFDTIDCGLADKAAPNLIIIAGQ